MKAHIGTTIELPTQHGTFQVTHVAAYDGSNVVREGVVLQRHFPKDGPVFVRVQSSCLFSESFWASDCDCALQLQASMEKLSVDGGLLLYFYEEGRGAGLEAKFKAIQLQQSRGMTTTQAFECLNINPDLRSYDAAAAVLSCFLTERSICLLTNNPAKAAGLKAHGINVEFTAPLICGVDRPAVRDYLRDKAKLLGHQIPEPNEN